MDFRRLHPDFGVEVTGFDVESGGSDEEKAALRAAWDAHGLLLFRAAARLSPERHLEIASWFGPPPPVANAGADDFVTVLANENAAGTVELPFHSDLTYTDDPIQGICLHALALPEGGTTTTFVSGVAAWQRLPDDLKAELGGKTLRHRLGKFSRDYDWPVFVADHPVKLEHPRTGAPVLFVTQSHAQKVHEMDEERSASVIADLFKRLYAPERRYVHHWQLHDLLLIDNIALQHARTEHADPGQGARALQRVALSWTTLDELVERARQRERQGA